ncbi:MAG: urease subunit beta [Nitrosotalea sp.]
MKPGEYFISKEPIIANVGRKITNLKVSNTGDRPIQVGSHTHFFEVNKFLLFQREQSYGFHLNIPSGLSVRFEPGETKVVELVEYGGKKIVYGFNGLVNGELQKNKTMALEKAKLKGFKGA